MLVEANSLYIPKDLKNTLLGTSGFAQALPPRELLAPEACLDFEWKQAVRLKDAKVTRT